MTTDQALQREADKPGSPGPAGTAWGDPITERRQAELEELLRAWEAEADHGTRLGPFAQVELTGACVAWLAARAIAGVGGDSAAGEEQLRTALDDVSIRSTLDLSALHLEGADLSDCHLERTSLNGAHLEQANLARARLDDAGLGGAHLEGARLTQASLVGSLLLDANLKGCDLYHASLEGSELYGAHLEQAFLVGAHLERANLTNAHLDDADLREVSFDKASRLNGVVLTGARLDQVIFDRTNLAVVDWSLVTRLREEQEARQPTTSEGEAKDRSAQLEQYKAAVRANRQLAVVLRDQGLNEDADRYSYRAQVLKRDLSWRQRKWLTYGGSLLLDGLAGYGFKPGRALLVYLGMIASFAVGYLLLGQAAHVPLNWLEALVFSVTSFHGRGFSPGGSVTLSNPLTVLAALEAMLGLLVEITFIATFTQRFFGGK
jgi:uncharacterized protein YjbI with pentapeptide repeats